MKQLIVTISVSCLFIIGCNQTGPKQSNTDIKNSAEDSASIFSPSVTNWINTTLKTTNTTLYIEERWKDDSLMVEPFPVSANFAKDFNTVLRWSPDSTHILDIGTYGANITKDKNGQTKLEYSQPDTELALIDTKNNERIRLLYVGPSAEILDGKWLDNSELMILGTFTSDNGIKDTLSWKVDISTNIFALYNVKAGR